LGDRFAYNVGEKGDAYDLGQGLPDDDAMSDMSIAARIEFLKQRCLTLDAYRAKVENRGYYPYDDYLVEEKQK
ncbi:MAG: hypothetical protein HYZ45_10420, partial [Burkholderiales bacterium]|nr:hypothetical protein [Burkholderiales bacterium]